MAGALALLLTGMALAVFFIQRRVLAGQAFTTVSGKGDAGVAMALPRGVLRTCQLLAGPWLAFTVVIYLFAFAGGFVQTWGRDWTLTLAHFRTAFDVQWAEHGILWAGTAWKSLFTTISLSALAAPICAALGLLMAWLLARTDFHGRAAFEFAALLTFAIPHGAGRELHHGLQRAAVRAHRHRAGHRAVLRVSQPAGGRARRHRRPATDRPIAGRSLADAARQHRVHPAPRGAAAAAPGTGGGAGLQLRAQHDHRVGGDLLVTAQYELATTYIIGRVGNGDYGVALAYCTVLMAVLSLATLIIQKGVGERRLGRRTGTDTGA